MTWFAFALTSICTVVWVAVDILPRAEGSRKLLAAWLIATFTAGAAFWLRAGIRALRFRRGAPTAALSMVLPAALLAFTPSAQAQTYTTSNGVTVQELAVAASGNVAGHRISWQTETMDVTTTSVSSEYATELIDDELLLEYHFYYDANGEKQVSRIDATYDGVTRSQYGSGYRSTRRARRSSSTS